MCKVQTLVVVYTTETAIKVEDKSCVLSIEMHNTGDDDVIVKDGLTIAAGSSRCLPHFEGRFYANDIEIRWGGTTSPRLEVVFYLEPKP